MSNGQLDTVFTADETELLKAQAKLIREQEKFIEKLKKTQREGKKAGKDTTKEMERYAATVKRITATPLEKQKEEMKKLQAALKAGAISQEHYNRRVRQLGDAQRSAFGGAVGNIAAMTSSFLGLSVIIGGVSRAISEVGTQLDNLGDKQRQDAPGLAELSQLAETPEELAYMISEAKKTFASGATDSLGDAGKLQFALESAGLGKWREDVAQLQASGTVGDATSLINAAAAMETALGSAETGGFRAIMSKAFGASKIAPARMEGILAASAKTGAQAKALGISDEELLASVGAVSKVTGDEKMAGTQIQSLFKQIEKYGIEGGYLEHGKTLSQHLDAIDKWVNEGENIRDILGDRQEGINAFRTLIGKEGRGLFNQSMSNIAEAERTDAFGRKVKLAESIPELTAAQAVKSSEAKAELAGSRSATYESLADAVTADRVAEARREHGEAWATIIRAGQWLDRRTEWGGNQAYIKENWDSASDETRRKIDLAERSMATTAEAMAEAAVELRESVGSNTNAARANQQRVR